MMMLCASSTSSYLYLHVCTMLSRYSILIIVFPVFVAFLWRVLDANPALFVYDLTVSNRHRYAAFENKTIWVTGASSGIGAELVCELVKAQAFHVILSARRDEKLKEVAERCSNTYIAARTKLSILPYDASQLDRVKETVQAALSMANHRIDVLILNAGVYQLEPALSTSMETTQYLLRVNFESPVALATQVIRQDDWKSRGRGQIVAVTSLVARGPQSLTSSYAASKAALRNYLFTLSTEEAGWLQVNVALPGATRTNLWDSLDTGSTTNTDNAKANKRARDEVKMSPQRVARLILTGAAGPSLLFYEMFITKPIGLVWVYLSLYTPTLFHILVHVIGYIRVQVWNQTGSDTLDVPTLLKSTIDMLMGRL